MEIDTDEQVISNGMENLKINRKILSIDIGVRNLALSVIIIDDDYNFVNLEQVHLIDITKFNCLPNCPLYHSKTMCDWVSHILYNHEKLFMEAEHVLIERQPPQGFVVVEQLLFCTVRAKATLISPNSVHKYFGMGMVSYEKRKELSEKIAEQYINPAIKEQLKTMVRIHDITDSILITIYWCSKKKEEREYKCNMIRKKKMLRTKIAGKDFSLNDFVKMYSYVPGFVEI